MTTSNRIFSTGLAILRSVLILIIGSLSLPAMGQLSVKLLWNANPEPDIAGYRLHIGTTSGAYTDVRDVGAAISHVVDGLSPSTTYHFMVRAYNADGLVSEPSEEVTYTTMPGGEYGIWAGAASLSGTAAAPTAMPWSDGVPNLLKYAFNLNAAAPDSRVLERDSGTAGLPLVTFDRSGAVQELRVEFIRRKNAGLGYTPKISTDLRSYRPMTGDISVIELDIMWERVVIRRPCDPVTEPRLFATVEVILLQ